MSGTTQSGADSSSDLSQRARNLGTMFVPKSVAIIGASQDMTRIGGRPIQYTLDAGYAGRVYPVNPKHEEVAGLRCYPDLASIPESVDLCIVAVPARHVLDTLHSCVEAGVRSVVVFSSGFAEAGEQGQEAQASMRRLARSSGINVLGPNCLGVLSYESGLMGSFTSSLEVGNVAAGNIGFVCQSGAFGTYFLSLARARNMKFSHWVATGNEADVSTTDCIAYMALDPATKVIAGYVEGVQDGPRFREALELARDRGKPVILLKAGRSDLGARAAVSHTASMAGNDAVFDAVFERHGVCRAEDTHELLNFAEACSYGALPAGDRVCLVTVSGGVGIMMADRAAEVGLEMPSVPEDTQARMKDRLPYAATMNPVDFTAQFINEPDLLETFLGWISDTGCYDAVLTFLGHTILAESLAAQAVPAYIKVAERSNIPLFLSGVASPRFEEQLHENQLAILDNPTQAVDTIKALARISSGLRNSARKRISGATDDASERNLRQVVTGVLAGPAARSAAMSERPVVLGEGASRAVLGEAGIPFARGGTARDEDQAAALATEIGYPVVLKIDSPDISHKSEVDGVVVGLANEAKVRDAYHAILRSVRRQQPDAEVEGVLVEEMLDDGLQVIVGMQRDTTFGPVVLFGMGGIYAEVFHDREVGLAPFSAQEARDLVLRTRVGRVLTGERGQPPYDMDALAENLSRLSRAAATEPRLLEVDINPLLVRPSGQGVRALDALVVLDPAMSGTASQSCSISPTLLRERSERRWRRAQQ